MIHSPGYATTDWDGNPISANYIAGEINSVQYFQYGVFECDAKFAHNSASFPAFWLMSSEPCVTSFNNEIDIAECHNAILQNNIFYYSLPCGAPSKSYGFKETDNVNWDINHTLKCIWDPYKITFWIDDIKTQEVVNTGGWYPQLAMRLILSQQISDGNVITPQTSYFNWVRVKEFFLPPEITCPNVVCSTETAILDVVSEASNITWTLSPGYLFSEALSGVGKIAPIITSSNSGEGKIIFSFEMPGGEYFTAQKTFWVGVPDDQTDGFQIEGGGMGYESPLPCIYYYDNRRYGVHINKSMDGADWHTWEGMVYPGSLYGSNFEASFIPMDPDPPYYGSGYVMVKGGNTCGSSIPVAIGYGPCDYLLSFTPNPSNDETTLSIESLSKNAEVDESVEWDMDIYNQAQGLMKKKVKLKGKSYRISTSGWIEGVYFVRVRYMDEVISGTLIVKR